MGIWQEVFKTGFHTDSNGSSQEWTESDLDNIVNQYNLQSDHQAPIVVGHPKNDAPAYGWVEKLKREGKTLYASFKEVDEGLKNLVNEGKYKKVSIALYPDKLLRHIGFLGAMPPAVKGLKPLSFNEEKEFNEYEITITNRQFNEPTQGSTMNDKLLVDLVSWIKTTYNEEMSSQINSKITELKAKYANANDANTANTAGKKFEESKEFEEYKNRISVLEQQNKEMRFNEYFNSQIGRLVPAQKNLVKQAFNVVDNSIQIEFSEGNNKIQLAGEEVLKKLIESFPKQVEFNEAAAKENAITSDIDEQNKFIEEFNKRR